MNLLSRLLLYLLLLLGGLRMVLYFLTAAVMLPIPQEAHNLEAKMVLLAYRAQHGLRLYPAWWDYPHVANVFGPVNSVLVGLAGRVVGADFRGLFLIGRAVSFGSALLTTVVAALWTARHYGRWAALAASVMSLGSEPMNGFTVMVRADALSDLLGISGFLLSGGRRLPAQLAGVALLVLAALTKQTAGVYLLAAALALVLEGRWRQALEVLGASLFLLVVLVAAVNVLIEPYFAVSLVSVATMLPWDFHDWYRLLERMLLIGSDVLLLPLAGLVLWLGDRPRGTRPAALAIVLLSSSLALSGKVGADMNYYLSLRIPEALAVGALWRSVHAPAVRSTGRTIVCVVVLALAVLALAAAIVPAGSRVVVARGLARLYRTPQGQAILRSYGVAFALAEDPKVHILTDSGLIDLHQGARAAYGDAWLLRKLIEVGKIQPTTMTRRIDSQFYEMIITAHDLDSPRYLKQDFRLPLVLLEHIRTHYVFRQRRPGLYYYGRRDESWPPRGRALR